METETFEFLCDNCGSRYALGLDEITVEEDQKGEPAFAHATCERCGEDMRHPLK